MWQNGSPTNYGVEVFTHGDCWILAYSLAKRLDNKIALIGGETWGHAVAVVPGRPKQYLDINGWHDSEPLIKEYTWRGIKDITILDISKVKTLRTYRKTIYEYPEFLEPSYLNPKNPLPAANRIADKVIAKYL